MLYGWKDLNEENDNCSAGSPLDCYDPKTGLYHQVKGRYHSSKYGFWPFSGFDRDWEKKYENMVCSCYSEDGKIVERIYKILWIEIMKVESISIFKDPTNVPLYEKYRIGNKDELERANEIWKDIFDKK